MAAPTTLTTFGEPDQTDCLARLGLANPDTLGIDAAVFRELIDAVWAD